MIGAPSFSISRRRHSVVRAAFYTLVRRTFRPGSFGGISVHDRDIAATDLVYFSFDLYHHMATRRHSATVHFAFTPSLSNYTPKPLSFSFIPLRCSRAGSLSKPDPSNEVGYSRPICRDKSGMLHETKADQVCIDQSTGRVLRPCRPSSSNQGTARLQ